jgi:hypothetical protein
MKFAIGFVVGAAVGRPVLSAVSRKIRLAERIEKKVATVVYDVTGRVLKRMEQIVFEDGDVPQEGPYRTKRRNR